MGLKIAAGPLVLGKAGGLQIKGGTVAAATPTSILSTGLFREWSVQDITGKVDGDAISSWATHSAVGGPLQQTTGARQPLYKTNINNSKPAVRFDGVDDFLLTLENAGQGTINRWVGPFTPWEVWIVMKKRSTAAPPGGAVGFICMDDAGTNQVVTGAGVLPQVITAFSGTNLSTASTFELNTGFHLWRFSINGATSAITEDGTSKASGNAGSTVLRALAVGANLSAAGALDLDVQHILVVNRVTTAGEQTSLRTWSQGQYATP